LGTPTEEELYDMGITDYGEQVIDNIPLMKNIPFKLLFPKANPKAMDLLEKMLSYSPKKRITVEEALSHEYFEQLHDEEDEVNFYFNFFKI
jgi:serine/threonine protein kinase